jgi:hypothetical protein
MRANITILWVLSVFFLLAATGYTVWHMISYNGAVEWVGTLGMGLCAVLSAFIAAYLGIVHRTSGGQLPEDDVQALIDDGDPEIGHFAPWSWWPVFLAGSLMLLFMGLAISVFLVPIGAALVVIMLVGWVFEFYRGNFGR